MNDKDRKSRPLYSGVLIYFPDALLEVAAVSLAGNDQHNPGERLHWAKEKSMDELDSLSRHLLEAGSLDTDGMRHSAKLAWRALANLQREIETSRRMAAAGPVDKMTFVPTYPPGTPGPTVPTGITDGMVPLTLTEYGRPIPPVPSIVAGWLR